MSGWGCFDEGQPPVDSCRFPLRMRWNRTGSWSVPTMNTDVITPSKTLERGGSWYCVRPPATAPRRGGGGAEGRRGRGELCQLYDAWPLCSRTIAKYVPSMTDVILLDITSRPSYHVRLLTLKLASCGCSRWIAWPSLTLFGRLVAVPLADEK